MERSIEEFVLKVKFELRLFSVFSQFSLKYTQIEIPQIFVSFLP